MRFNKEQGQASRLLLVLAVVVLVAVIITFLILKWAEKPPAPPISDQPTITLPVYEVALGNINFSYITAIDRGGVLKASDSNKKQTISQKDYVISNPGAVFIQVTVGAENIGTVNTDRNAWKLGNIVDSLGRNFVPVQSYAVNAWLPEKDLCGEVLKPAFDPTPCSKIYEVSKESTGLKVRVETGKNNSTVSSTPDKNETALIDLIIK